MTADRRQEAREFHAAAGGEYLEGHTVDGNAMLLNALPIPDGTVRVMLTAVIPGVGPFGVQVIVTADEARRMGALISRVADR